VTVPTEPTSTAEPSGGRPGGALPRPFLACLAYAVRACVPPKRWALLALPAAGAVLFGLLATLGEGTDGENFDQMDGAILGLVLPFACLVVGDAVLGGERRSGTLALTWLSPVPFRTIVLARWLAGWAVSVVALVPGMALATVVAGVPERTGALLVGVVAAAAAYVGLFMLVGALTLRGTLWSLAIVILGEQMVGGVLTAIAQLSPRWLARTAYAGLGPEGTEELLVDGVPSGWGAVLRLAIITAVTLALTVHALRRIRLAGAVD
jgi:hypothetical protein